MVERNEVQLFAEAVVSRLGLAVDEHNIDLVAQVLQKRLNALKCGFTEYLNRLADPDAMRAELRTLALDFTVPETYFFRHPEQFAVLKEVAIPQIMKSKRGDRHINILSAGCASGEEAYSIAAAVREIPELDQTWRVAIIGVDINKELLGKAVSARYPEWSLRSIPGTARKRYFNPEGKRFALRNEFKSAVRFEEHNILDEDRAFWSERNFDIVFFRNVMIYFTPASIKTMVDRLSRSLVPNGFLFLSPSETLRGFTKDFHLRHTNGTFYYQRRSDSEPAPHSMEQPFAAGAHDVFPPGAPDTEWMSDIANSADRIASMEARMDLRRQPPSGSPVTPIPAADLAEAKALFQQERYDDALRSISSVHAGPLDSDTLLLKAILLSNKGQVSLAEEICERLLSRDELRPGAHYLLAICRERTGDLVGAMEHDRTAIYLDPKFSMPRLHFGLLAKRLGDKKTATRELSEAADLLLRDDASRIVLFGGGFSREALIGFCRTQLELIGEDK